MSTAVKKIQSIRPAGVVPVKTQPKRVAELFVAVAKLDTGEGIYSVTGPDGQTLPVVAIDDRSLNSLMEFARQQVLLTGRTVSIIGFTKRTQRHTFRPSATGDKK